MSVTPKGWEEIKRVFEHALELDSSQRSEYLREQVHDAAVRAEVERLIAEHEEARHFLSTPALGEVTTETRVKLSAGDTIAGRFRIVRFIAAGGMGEVYEADDLELRERVAIKTIPNRLLEPRAISGLRREVQLARKVTHPNVCRVFDLFRGSTGSKDQNTFFVSMELLQGKTLSMHLRESGAFRLPEAMPLLRQLAAGLSAAHAVGVIHGDLKPGNIFLEDRNRQQDTIRAVITDFGLAVPTLDFAASSFATLSTMESGVRGTPGYMAPEQLRGQRATVASDVYAFALVVYEMITNTRAFVEDNIPLLINAILTKAPKPPSSVVTNLPESLDAVVLRALDRDPARRYQSADEFMEALEGHTLSLGGARASLSRPQTGWKWLAAFALVLLLAGVGGYSYHKLASTNHTHNTQPRTSLAFSIVAQQLRDGKPGGEPYRVSDQQPFSAGMGIHLTFRSPEAGYLYILNEAPASTDSAPLFNVIFPSQSTQGGSARLDAGQDLIIPENGPLVFDDRKGTEKVWLVWSKRRLDELESLTKWANSQNRGRIGNAAEAHRIKSFLDTSRSSSPQVNRDSTNHVNLVTNGENLVYLLSLNHI